MRSQRRVFDIEFKQKLVQKILSGEASSGQICREYGLSTGVIHNWVQQAKAGVLRGTPHAPTLRERDLERENWLLKQKLAELYLQVESLKKMETWRLRTINEHSSVITSNSLTQSRKPAK